MAVTLTQHFSCQNHTKDRCVKEHTSREQALWLDLPGQSIKRKKKKLYIYIYHLPKHTAKVWDYTTREGFEEVYIHRRSAVGCQSLPLFQQKFQGRFRTCAWLGTGDLFSTAEAPARPVPNLSRTGSRQVPILNWAELRPSNMTKHFIGGWGYGPKQEQGKLKSWLERLKSRSNWYGHQEAS